MEERKKVKGAARKRLEGLEIIIRHRNKLKNRIKRRWRRRRRR
jgi:hypothetical protein